MSKSVRQNESKARDVNKVFMARQEFFKAISRLAPEVLENLNISVLPHFLKTDLVNIELHDATSYFDQDCLLETYPMLSRELSEWADKYCINTDWCIKMALRTLLYWAYINKEESAKHISIEEAIKNPDKYLIAGQKTKQPEMSPTQPSEWDDLAGAFIKEERQNGRLYSEVPGKLTWFYDNIHGGNDLAKFECHWNPYIKTRDEFEAGVRRRLDLYLEEKERLFSHRIGKRTYLAKPEHFDWVVLYRVQKLSRSIILSRYPHITSETTLSEAKTILENLLDLPRLPNRVGAPKKSS